MFRSMFVSLLCLALCVCSVQSFTCLGDDKKQILFKNHDEATEVPGLHTVRVMIGGYSSQLSLNYAAYMFMQEKLGMPVDFFPLNDPDEFWNLYNWSNMSKPEHSYPQQFFEWLAADEGDVEFEYWLTHEERGNAAQYIADGSIEDGITGLFGEISWYMPKYFVDANPYSIIPYELKNNETLRQMLRDAYTIYSDYNYLDAFGINGTLRNIHFPWSMPNDTNETYVIPSGTVYHVPTLNNSNPIVWGSWEGYAQNEFAQGLADNVLGGLGFDFVSTSASGEGGLKDFVTDLYSKKLPFIANLYVPDENFGVWDNETNDFQQFEKVAFDRNPAQNFDDPCALGYTCQWPVEPIKKAANTRLETTFPEAYQFFKTFYMPATHVNLIVDYYNQIKELNSGNSSLNMTTNELWLNASCAWLKDPLSAEVWDNSNWLIDVQRWDCIPGCGFPATEGDQDYVGGSCDYRSYQNISNTDQGTCNCEWPEFYGPFCNNSCPGTSDPIWSAANSEYSFEFCSNHGDCDVDTHTCTCDLGYGGDGCGSKYARYEFPVALAGVIIAFSSILAIITIGCIVWLRMNKQYKTVKALSVDMTTVFSVGLVFLCMSNVALVVPLNDASCIAWQWLFGMGGVMAIMSPLLKAYRVSRVFHGGKMLRAVKITDKMLMQTLLKAVLIQFLVITAYTVCHQVFGGITLYYDHEEKQVEPRCNQFTATQYLSNVSYAYFVLTLLALTKFSYGTRRALSVFKESTCAYSSSFLAVFCTLIVAVFTLAAPDPTYRYAVQCFALIIVVTAVLSLFYATRVYKFFTEPENRNVTDMRSPTYTSSSTTGAYTNNNGPPDTKV